MTVAFRTVADAVERGHSASGSSARTGRRWARLIPHGVETAGFALFFLMLFVPAAYKSVKAALLVPLLVALAARVLMERRISLHPQVAFGCVVFSVIGAAYVLRGYLAGAPGAVRMSTVYVIWPWINALLITGLADEARLWRLARLMVWTTVAICVYCGSFILWSAGWLPNALYLPLDQAQAIAFYDGYMEFGVRSLASLLFLVPFVTAAVLTWSRNAPLSRATLWLALALGLVIGLLSGRRALQLALALGLPLGLILQRLLPRNRRSHLAWGFKRTVVAVLVVGTLALLLLRLAFGMSPGVLWAVFQTGFQFSDDPVASTRASQFEALIQGWLSSPLIGSGHGASASIIRSAEMPWAYELSYAALLFHTGVFGTLAYGLGVAWIYAQGLRLIRHGTTLAALMVATLTGTTTFLIANATNPYLEKFDCLWTLFLPLAVVNLSLLKGNVRASQQSGDRLGRGTAAPGGPDIA
jgi:hypothetical protein